jgi:hypothetical protein
MLSLGCYYLINFDSTRALVSLVPILGKGFQSSLAALPPTGKCKPSSAEWRWHLLLTTTQLR